jgi:hypothetical protein
MNLKDEVNRGHKKILDNLEMLEGHLKPRALSLIANEVRHLLVGLAASLHYYKQSQSMWQLSEKAALDMDQLDKVYQPLQDQFDAYKQEWMILQAIESAPDKFVQTTKAILMAIYKYLNLEKEKLVSGH